MDCRISPVGATCSEFECVHSSTGRADPAHAIVARELEFIPGSEFVALVRSLIGSRNLKGSHTSVSVPAVGFHRRMLVPACKRLPWGARPASKNGSFTILPRCRTVSATPSAPGRSCSCISLPAPQTQDGAMDVGGVTLQLAGLCWRIVPSG